MRISDWRSDVCSSDLIQFHDAGMTMPAANGSPMPVFDMLTIARGGRQPYDSRKAELDDKPSIAVLLLDHRRIRRPTPRSPPERRRSAHRATHTKIGRAHVCTTVTNATLRVRSTS